MLRLESAAVLKCVSLPGISGTSDLRWLGGRLSPVTVVVGVSVVALD